MCDRLSINRLLVGKGGATTKGLIERHIALTKYAMLKLAGALREEGIDISYSDLCSEICMSQNLLLECEGGTPQMAFTGQSQRGWFTPDSDTIESIVGTLAKKPDTIETMVRTRLLAKQCIIQGLIQQRLAQAIKIKQHKHGQDLLLPGTTVDYWRDPQRKDENGWRGPAELLSLERTAGSAIIKHQGQPLIMPLHQLRRHVLYSFFATGLASSADSHDYDDYCNPELVKEAAALYHIEDIYNTQCSPQTKQLLQLMDFIDGTSPGRLLWIGIHCRRWLRLPT